MADDSKIWAFLGVFLTIIGFIIVMLAKKDDKYAMYYAKQGLMLFIVGVVIAIVGWILLFIPIIGLVIQWLLNIVMLVLWILGWVYALQGEMKPVPVIGKYAEDWFKNL
ncbi:DUF4870 domain-containing protein [Candidatus Woesearchaeota archaeon]|nr:DUF4870 domain-containing protein [Candidatus Woesearchaeota archaeon]MBW3022304.1 DUF4870 domain-containing protein [Candidatus Woesearchaeota archaeon]